jgi:hypothetical protein
MPATVDVRRDLTARQAVCGVLSEEYFRFWSASGEVGEESDGRMLRAQRIKKDS